MSERSDNRRPMSWWVGVAMFFAVLASLFLFQLMLTVVVIVTGKPGLLSSLFTPPGLTVQVVFMTAVLIFVSLGVPKLFSVPPTAFLRLVPSRPAVYIAAALGVIGVGFVVDEVTFFLHHLSPTVFDASGLSMFNAVFLDASPVWFVVITVAVSLGPGVGEELFFRGFVLRTFRPSMPAWLAVLLSSAMFGLIHSDPLQSPGAGLIGLYLGFVALITGSLWPAMLAHALNNFVCALVARFGGPEISQVWITGHSPWILIGALVLTGACTFALFRMKDDLRD